MQILVTGGAGFIGSHTVDALLARGYAVRVLDSLEPPVHTGMWPAYLSKDVERVLGNVTDRDIVKEALKGVDCVFHFAAYQDYHTDFSRFFHTNSVGTALLYEVIAEERLPIQKVIVASSQAVYGEGKYLCHKHGTHYPEARPLEQLEQRDWSIKCGACGASMEPQWTDEAVVSPHNSYALSKRDQEEIALKLGRRYGIPSVALRYSIVQGPRQSFHNAYSGALRAFTVRVLSNRSPMIYEDGEQMRDYVSVHDVVRANLLVLDDPQADYQVFNVGGGHKMTVRELADSVIGVAGARIESLIPGVYRVGDTRHIFSDISHLCSLGWAPRVPQSKVVEEYLDWASRQPGIRDTFADAQAKMEATGVLRTARQ